MPSFRTFVQQQPNTPHDYGALKQLYKEFCARHGEHHFKNNEVIQAKDSSIPIFTSNTVNVSQIPFTFLKMLSSISPDHPSQSPIPKHIRSKYAILKNRPEFGGIGPDDPHWATAKTNPSASMSAYHQFVAVRDFSWSLFNALTFGEDPEFQSKKEVLTMLEDLETIATNWAGSHGITNVGCFFHVYPFNSVQSLHMHMVDLNPENLGEAWKEYATINTPLSSVKSYFESLKIGTNSNKTNSRISKKSNIMIFKARNSKTPEKTQLLDLLNQLCHEFYHQPNYTSCLGKAQTIHKNKNNRVITVFYPESQKNEKEKCTDPRNKSIYNRDEISTLTKHLHNILSHLRSHGIEIKH
jgi:hypothetical protein